MVGTITVQPGDAAHDGAHSGPARAPLFQAIPMVALQHRGATQLPDPLRQVAELLETLPNDWLQQAWTGEHGALERVLQQQLQALDGAQPPEQAVALVLLLWCSGAADLGDTLLLELDDRWPAWGLVPDHWGLWPGAAEPGPLQAALKAVLRAALDWRHGPNNAVGDQPALSLWREWATAADPAAAPFDPEAAWRRLLEPAALVRLLLLLAPEGAADRLRGELEPQLVEAVGERVVEQHPQEALRFWSGISQRCPSWDYARLKTADLSLQSGQLQRCAVALAAATAEQRSNPWLHDIQARLAMAQGQPAEALRCWEAAMAAATGDGELVELLRQRRREAEWEVELSGGMPVAAGSGEADLERFAQRLDALAQRFQVVLPLPPAGAEANPEAFAAFLDQAGGRLALAG